MMIITASAIRFFKEDVSKYLFINIALGVALGTGYMTSLRFYGPVGISEIIIFTVFIMLIMDNPAVLTKYGSGIYAYVKAYLLLSFIVILPIVTLIVSVFTIYSDLTSPIYLISFPMGLLISFLIADGIRDKKIDMRVVSLFFLIVFLVSNALTLYFDVGYYHLRYTGFSNNPNQLLFYLASLSLLLVIYNKIYFFISAPFLIYIGFVSGSDAYTLGLYSSLCVFVFLCFFYIRSMSVYFNVLFFLIIAFLLAVFFIPNNIDYLVGLWNRADEGGVRVNLISNALEVIKQSPFFGWGVGEFSGKTVPFEGKEAHNNIFDLAMQFGLVVPIIIYGVIFFAILNALKKHEFLIVSFMVGFVISGLFHFSARHFVFWVEFGVFLYYITRPTEVLKSDEC